MSKQPTIAERLYKLFPSSPRAHGEMKLGKKSDKSNKVSGAHATVATPPTVELWDKHVAGTQSIGCIPIMPDNKCHWGCIDFDKYDGLDLVELDNRIQDMGIPLTVCRSKSGGAHLLLRLKNPASCAKVRGHLKEIAVVLNVDKFDLYPRQDTVGPDQQGNWLNMPYFNASKTDRYAIIDGAPADVNTFIETMFERACTLDDLKALKLVPDHSYHGTAFTDAPPCLGAVLNSEGGKIRAGNRNEMLYNFGVLAKLSLKEATKDTLTDELNKYNQKFIDPPLSTKEVTAMAGQLVKSKSCFYKCNADPIVNFCDKQVCKSKVLGLGHDDPEAGTDSVPHIQLYKYTSNPPIWEIDIDGVRSRLLDPKLFMSQTEMDKLMVNSINKRLPPIKPAGYRLLTQKWLDNAILLEMPDDASVLGEFMSAMYDYCFSDMVASNKKEVTSGYCWHGDELVYVTTNGILQYLRSVGLVKYDRRDVLATLKFMGAERALLRYAPPKLQEGDTGVVQSWGIPKTAFQHITSRIVEDEDED